MTEEQYAELRRKRLIPKEVAKLGHKGFVIGEESKRRLLRAANGEIEAIFELQLLEAMLPRWPIFQHQAIEGRHFKLDVAFPAYPYLPLGTAFEVQGHVHRIKHQFLRDMERHNTLTLAGWTMYYVSGKMVRSGAALELVRKIIR